MTDQTTRCGYVAVLGAPNAGKSTLVNLLVGSKVSIVSPKVQTTRSKVLGIQVKDGAQILYVDTPAGQLIVEGEARPLPSEGRFSDEAAMKRWLAAPERVTFTARLASR